VADSSLSLIVKFAALDRLTQPLRTMSGASKAAARDIASTRKEVLQLEKASAKVGAFKDQQAAIAKTHKELDEARRRVTALRAAMAQADGPVGRLSRSMEAAQAKVKRLSDRLPDQADKLHALRRELGDSGIDVSKLGTEQDRLARAIARTNAKLTEQTERQQRAANQAKRLERASATGANLRAGGFRALAVGSQIIRPGIAVAQDARDFQSILVDIGQKADLTQVATRKIGDNLLRIAPKLAQLPADLATGIDILSGLGLDPTTAAKIIAPIGRAATAYKADIADLSNATFSSIDNLKLPIGQTARALDIMAKAGKDGAFELKDMAREFPALTAAAAALGQRGAPAIADLAAAAQIARKGAGDSATAANNLLNLLNKINTKDTFKNFKDFGIDLPKALKKAAKDGKSPIEAILELTNKATKGDASKLAFLFQDAQVQAALRPLLQNIDLYRQIRSDALKATGTVERDFNGRLANDGASSQAKFNAQLERLKITLGERVLPTLNRALELGGQFADRVSQWAERNPKAAGAITLVVTALGILLTVLGAVLIGLGFIWRPLVTIAGWLGRLGPLLRIFGGLFGWIARVAFIALSAVAAAVGLPVWAVGLLVAAVAVAGILIYRNWERIKQGAAALWTGLRASFAAGVAWFTGIVAFFLNIGVRIGQGLANGLGSTFAMIRDKIVSLGKSAIGWFKGVLGIKSPSRVFAGLGEYMTAGLTMGLDRGAQRPIARIRALGSDLTRAAAITVAASTPALAQPAAATRAAPPPTASIIIQNLVINQQPGQDGAELARQFRAEIEKFDREKQARGRSSYADEGE